MNMWLLIGLLAVVLAAVVLFFLLRPEKPKAEKHVALSAETYGRMHERRMKGDRRSGKDKREDIRFDLEKTPRRSGAGRRKGDNLWKED